MPRIAEYTKKVAKKEAIISKRAANASIADPIWIQTTAAAQRTHARLIGSTRACSAELESEGERTECEDEWNQSLEAVLE